MPVKKPEDFTQSVMKPPVVNHQESTPEHGPHHAHSIDEEMYGSK
jgi:hypothetical protein